MHELTSRRTLNSKIFALGGDKYKLVCSKQPIHYDDGGELLDINTAPYVDARGKVVAHELPYIFELLDKGIGFTYFSKKNGRIKLSLTALNDTPIDATKEYNYTIENNKIIFNNVAEDLDIIFVLKKSGLQTFRVLKSANAPTKFTWTLESDADAKKLINDKINGWDNKKRKIALEINSVEDNDNIITTETWNGSVKVRDKVTRLARWDNTPEFPVIIDPDITEEVVLNSDDATDDGTGSVAANSLKFGYYSYLYTAGIRFQSVAIPQGAVIDSGSLKLNVTELYSYGSSGVIYGFDTDNTSTWSAGNQPKDATRTSASTVINRPAGVGIVNYNVKDILQEIVNRGGWALNNNLSFIIVNADGTNRFTAFEDFNDAGTDEPLLEVDFTGGGPTETFSSGLIPLFIHGHIRDSGNIPLFMHGHSSASGNITLHIISTEPSGTIPLYIAGGVLNSGEIPLVMFGATETGSITLFEQGHITNSGNIPLFIFNSAPDSGNITLFIEGTPPVLSGIMPLFLQGQIPSESSGNIPLFLWSTENSGLFNTIPLFVGYVDGTPDPNNQMPLVMTGPEFSTITSALNLVLFQDVEVENELTLFVKNEYQEGSGNIPLYLAAPSGTLGAVPISGALNLYMSREFEGSLNIIPLFLQTANPSSGLFTMFISGETTANSSVPMYVKGMHNPFDIVKLYTHGW